MGTTLYCASKKSITVSFVSISGQDTLPKVTGYDESAVDHRKY